jgi:hypothetical protein
MFFENDALLPFVSFPYFPCFPESFNQKIVGEESHKEKKEKSPGRPTS